MNEYYFIIDTDKYSGNFERQMCAYITGQVGSCGVGKEIATYARKELKIEIERLNGLIGSELNEDGVYRPAKIYPTPNIYNNGMGFHFKAGEEDLAKEQYKKTLIEEFKELSEEEYADELKRLSNKPIDKYPAYQSVAIFLCLEPNKFDIRLLKERAEKFAKICRNGQAKTIGGSELLLPKNLNIIGFRLIEKTTEYEEIKI